jgi:hypothetical protein
MTLKTINAIRKSFWEYLQDINPDLAAHKRSKKRQNDYCTDIRCSFVDYVDSLRKDGIISEKLANRATL